MSNSDAFMHYIGTMLSWVVAGMGVLMATAVFLIILWMVGAMIGAAR